MSNKVEIQYQILNCAGCRFADRPKVGTGDPCCQYPGKLEDSAMGCVTRRPSEDVVTVEFEDDEQDFLKWELQKAACGDYIVVYSDAQGRVWVGTLVKNKMISPGDHLVIETGGRPRSVLRHKVKTVKMPAFVYYRGVKLTDAGAQQVYVVQPNGDVAPLSPAASQKLWNHSPDGFQWGYGGSGPAQLALAILLDVTKDGDLAVKLHQKFKAEFVAGWADLWEISDREIKTWIDKEVKRKHK